MKRHDQQPPVLVVEDLSIAYGTRTGPVTAVRGVSFEIGPGEVVGLAGESGSGKSTVAFGVVGFLGPNGRITAGSVRFLGRELTGLSPKELGRLRGDRMAMVYQDPMAALNPALKVGDQLAETLICHGRASRKGAWRESERMLHRVHMPDPAGAMRRWPHQLSGGQQQRVLIAMALINGPALLIMDEPTTALDVTVEAAVLDLVSELKDELKTSILFISHDLAIMARVCDRLAIMYAGEIVERAPVERLFQAPAHPYTRGLLGCLPRPGTGRARAGLRPIRGQAPGPAAIPPGSCLFQPRCDHSRDRCRREHPGLDQVESDHVSRCFLAPEFYKKPLETAAPDATDVPGVAPAEQPSLTVRDLRVLYPDRAGRHRGWLGLGRPGTIRAVDGVDLSLGPGRTLGLVGESGCGKSTLARAIIGLEKTSAGSVEFLGADIGELSGRRRRRLLTQMQMVFQNPDATLNPAYSVGRQIGRALKKLGRVPHAGRRDEVLLRLATVRLGPEYVSRSPRSLSGGEKQRVAIARALAGRSSLVLCDEPVSSLDVSVQAAVLNLLDDLQAATGAGLILISHDLSVVRYLAHDVAVMYLGKIVESGPTEAVFQPPCHPYTEALLSAVPLADPEVRPVRIRLTGEVPSPADPPPGCPFHPRCPRIGLMPDQGRTCRTEPPPWRRAGTHHGIWCHLPLDRLSKLGRIDPDRP